MVYGRVGRVVVRWIEMVVVAVVGMDVERRVVMVGVVSVW